MHTYVIYPHMCACIYIYIYRYTHKPKTKHMTQTTEVLKAFKEADRNRDNKLNYDELHPLYSLSPYMRLTSITPNLPTRPISLLTLRLLTLLESNFPGNPLWA